MMQLLNNVRLAQGVVRQHLTDDPVILFLQLSRRLPSAVLPLAKRLCQLAPRNSTSAAVLFAALAAGDDADVERRLRIAADGTVDGERARRLADVALAANLPEVSDVFLAKAGAAQRLKQARHGASGTTVTSAKPSRRSTARVPRDCGSGPAWPLRRQS